jgi:hypothetical protein
MSKYRVVKNEGSGMYRIEQRVEDMRGEFYWCPQGIESKDRIYVEGCFDDLVQRQKAVSGWYNPIVIKES